MRQPWYLLADIGGTNARFAIGSVTGGSVLEAQTLSVADHPSFHDALEDYLRRVADLEAWEVQPQAACLAVAASTRDRVIRFTNSPWQIDREEIGADIGGAAPAVINDFEAIGHAIPALAPADWIQIGEGEAADDCPIAVLGAGTGLGVCSVLPGGNGARVLPGEGGHVDFAPVDETEDAVLRFLRAEFGRVSVERLLSGPGLVNIYRALASICNAQLRLDSPAAISDAAIAGQDPLAVETLELFCRNLGGVAGNLALTLGAHGGVYVAGGIAPRILDFLQASGFRERFLAKGRFRSYLSPIPTRVVTLADPGLRGALAYLQGSHGS